MIGFKDIFVVRTKGKRLSILANHYFEQGKKKVDTLLSLEFLKVFFKEYPCFGRNSRPKKIKSGF